MATMHDVVMPETARLRERRSAKWSAYGPDVLPLPIAEMDVELAEPIRRELRAAVERSDTGYAWAGAELGKALASFTAERWAWDVDPSAVTAVGDVGVGIVELLRVLCAPGDGVVVNPPVYAPFFEWIAEAGCRVVEAPLTEDHRLDLGALESAFAARPAAYLLCNPHNPVGRVHTYDELAAVVELAQRHDVTVLSDEVHAPLVHSGPGYTPMLTVPGARARAVALIAASKAWNLAGLKCGQLVTASEAMRSATRRLPAGTQFRAGHFGVLAAIAAYRDGGEWLDGLLDVLAARRALLARLLADELPAVRWQPPESTFLAWLDCRELGRGMEPYERFLAAGVATDNGPKFGTQGAGFVRLNFATSEDILTEAVRRMSGA